jgi:phenylalanyl-tRNA synthetase beta chain
MPKESFVAIDHRSYTLDPSMVVIADAQRAVAVGGVMGGEQSEVTDRTVDLLIESADFAPMAIRHAARSLKLHSPASFRFERKVDPRGVARAADRCCQRIQELAGGEVLEGMLDTAPPATTVGPEIGLRANQITRVLGIEIPWSTSRRILHDLGCQVREDTKSPTESLHVRAPSWRHDLTREIDLIEEVARIHGYEKIPDDALVPVVPSARRPKDVLLDRLRSLANAAGLCEAMTSSVVTRPLSDLLLGWPSGQPLVTQTPLLEGSTFLRRSLIPSLLQARQFNESQSNQDVHLFETSTLYLTPVSMDPRRVLPIEQWTMGIVAGFDLRELRGLIEAIVQRVTGRADYRAEEGSLPGLAEGTAMRFEIEKVCLAWTGRLDRSICAAWKIDANVVAAEVNLDALLANLQSVPQLKPLNPFPAISRDLNLVVAESLRWKSMEHAMRKAGGDLLTRVEYRETYRDEKKDGPGQKRILVTLAMQSPTQTLTSHQADHVVESIVQACASEFAARLVM